MPHESLVFSGKLKPVPRETMADGAEDGEAPGLDENYVLER